jgi:2-iminobutanoate/2-iminopropanoate deaminase
MRARPRGAVLLALLGAVAAPACASPEPSGNAQAGMRIPSAPHSSPQLPADPFDMSSRRIIASAHAPAAIGPYSQAVAHAGLVWCSGQIALDPASGQLVAGDVRAQAERVLDNLTAVLAAAGSAPEHVLRTTIYLVDMGDFGAVNEVYARRFPAGSAPARATVGVSSLPKGALVEIDCVAALPAAR